MAIGATALAGAYDGANSQTYATTAFASTADELNLFAIAATRGSSTNPPEPTITGGGTWVLVGSLDYDVSGTARAGIFLFRSMGAVASAVRTIDFGAGVTCTSCAHSVVGFSGVDTSGTNGSGAIVQTLDTGAGDSGTSNSITLAALGSADNVGYGMLAHASNEAVAAGIANEIHDVAGASPDHGLQTQWEVNQTLIDWSWATSAPNGGIAVEVKAAVAAGGTKPKTLLSLGIG